MPASPAQVAANIANSARSSGPKSPEGRLASSKNSLKHGLTATKLIPEREAAEVERRSQAFLEELKPSGAVGVALACHAARMSVRMERCAQHENATLAEHARRAQDEFVPPEGVTDPAELAKLRHAEERRALFDASKEATLARKYEAAAERSFFRALKELRTHERQVKAAQAEELEAELGSFLPGEMTDEEFDRLEAEAAREDAELAQLARSRGIPTPPPMARGASAPRSAAPGDSFDLPFSIGRPR
jgi:hypothetical protein